MDRTLTDARSIATVRRFNRAVTRRVAALDDSYLGRGRPLGQSRVLWEIGEDGMAIRRLRARLGLGRAHLTRILRELQAQGLVEVTAGPDSRARVARLTAKGRVERVVLDRRSDELALSILQPLDERRRARLVQAMADVVRLLVVADVVVEICDPASEDARSCFTAYVAELVERTDGDFRPADAPSLVTGRALVPPAGILLVARCRGDAVGTAAVTFDGAAMGTIHRMWVCPSMRGYGIGRQLLVEAEARAVAHGRTTLRLETKEVLSEAVALYRSAGYREVERFGSDLFADRWMQKKISRDVLVDEEANRHG